MKTVLFFSLVRITQVRYLVGSFRFFFLTLIIIRENHYNYNVGCILLLLFSLSYFLSFFFLPVFIMNVGFYFVVIVVIVTYLLVYRLRMTLCSYLSPKVCWTLDLRVVWVYWTQRKVKVGFVVHWVLGRGLSCFENKFQLFFLFRQIKIIWPVLRTIIFNCCVINILSVKY